jgi:hypothetical protein
MFFTRWLPVVVVSSAFRRLTEIVQPIDCIRGPPADKASDVLTRVGSLALAHAYIAVAATLALAGLSVLTHAPSARHALSAATWNVVLANSAFFFLMLGATVGVGATL